MSESKNTKREDEKEEEKKNNTHIHTKCKTIKSHTEKKQVNYKTMKKNRIIVLNQKSLN